MSASKLNKLTTKFEKKSNLEKNLTRSSLKAANVIRDNCSNSKPYDSICNYALKTLMG